jgi:hypothetical protein
METQQSPLANPSTNRHHLQTHELSRSRHWPTFDVFSFSAAVGLMLVFLSRSCVVR